MFFGILLVSLGLVHEFPYDDDGGEPNCKQIWEPGHEMIGLICEDIDDPEFLHREVQNVNSPLPVFMLLRYFNLPSFAPGTFDGIKLSVLVLSDGTIGKLSADIARPVLADQSNSLKEFRAFNVKQTEPWDPREFESLTKLSYIDIVKCDFKMMNRIQVFPEGVLKNFYLDYSQFNNFSADIFSKWNNIVELQLQGNEITKFERNMLPRPASFLKIINLKRNSIRFLALSVFREMPALRVVDLSFNLIMDLNERVFLPVVNSLDALFVSGNPVRCDSGVKWFKTSFENDSLPRRNDVQKLICATPSFRKGSTLLSVFDTEKGNSSEPPLQLVSNTTI